MSYSDSPLTAPPGEVDRSQETYTPSSRRPRRVPPSGDVSYDGSRPWPRPALSSKLLVWGGIGVAAAAASAGAVLGVRAILGRGDDEEEAALEEARERARRRSSGTSSSTGTSTRRSGLLRRSSARPRRPASAQPVPPPRPAGIADEPVRSERRPRPGPARARSGRGATGMLDNVNQTIQEMSSGVRTLLDTVNAAMSGFRSVAQQASGVVGEFREAADSIRSAMHSGPDGHRAEPPAGANPHAPPGMDDARSHRL